MGRSSGSNLPPTTSQRMIMWDEDEWSPPDEIGRWVSGGGGASPLCLCSSWLPPQTEHLSFNPMRAGPCCPSRSWSMASRRARPWTSRPEVIWVEERLRP